MQGCPVIGPWHKVRGRDNSHLQLLILWRGGWKPGTYRDTEGHVERALALLLWHCVIWSKSHIHSEPQSLHLAIPVAIVDS